MAEARTQPTTISVADHLAAIADPARRADCQALGKHKRAKACLYLKSLKDIDLDVLEALLRHAASEMRRRHPTHPDPESARHD